MAQLDDELSRRWCRGILPGLDRIRGVLDHLVMRRCEGTRVLIAGTNGKGSTSTFLEAILRAHGCRTGLFTSPHLIAAAERIRLDGVPVSEEVLAPALAAVAAAEVAAGVALTGFEWITAVAISIFEAAAIPGQIFEVGLGGRLDATNAWDPELSVITSLGLDHVELLGADLESVAKEKAGILRRGRPAALAAQAPEADAVLDAAAAAIGVHPLLREGVDWRWTWDGERFLWESGDGGVVGPVFLGLPGAHQGRNAALALAAAAQVLPGLTGVPLDPGHAARGLASTRLNGRFQLARVLGRRVLLDVAHNPHGVAALAASYRARWGSCPAVLVGLKDDKDADGVLGILAALTPRLIFCPLPGTPHHAPEALVRACPGPCVAEAAATPAEGLARLPVAAPGAPPPLVCGSHFLVGEVLRSAE